jgi:hypothetical protein
VRSPTLARLVLGGVLVADPGALLGGIHAPDRDDPRVLVVSRLLGGRLLVQGAVDLAWRGRMRRVGAAIEAAHALSMLPLAAGSSYHRRAATVSAAVALSLVILDV